MKTLTRLGLVIGIAAITGSMVHAGRPQCEEPRPAPWSNAVCFLDLAPYGYLALLASCDTEASDDPGTCLVYLFSSNDFWQFKPDGSIFSLANDAAADLLVCPAPGGFDCLMEYFSNNPDFPAPLTGMYTGEAVVTSAGMLDASGLFGCPFTIQGRGTVADLAGTLYVVRDNTVQIKNLGREEGCSVVINNISVTPK